MKQLLQAFYNTFGREVVFLDLETTGIDPETEKIIEIGAVRVRGDKVIDQFHTLVNPGIRVPFRISALTGIKDSMLTAAPKIDDVLGPLAAFIGEFPIFAHNSEFERTYLQRQFGNALKNRFYDTCYFSCLVLPDIRSYSLESLMFRFGIRSEEMHRALEDADDARRVMEQLIPLALENIPLALVNSFLAAMNPEEEMVLDFLKGIKALHELENRPPGQQIIMFDPPVAALPEPDQECVIELRNALAGQNPMILHAAPEGMRRASLGTVLAEIEDDIPTLVFVPEHDTLEHWRQAIGAERKDVLFLERLYQYVCPMFLQERIGQIIKAENATGFDLYLSLLLRNDKPILRHHVSSFLLHREEGQGNRLDLASESRWDCSQSNCGRHNCLLGKMCDALNQARIVVTYPSNLYILQHMNRLDLLPQKRVIVDGPEHIEEFHENHLESVRLSDAKAVYAFLLEVIQEGDEVKSPRAVHLLGLAVQYLEELLDCLSMEFEGAKFKQALSRDLPGMETILCKMLDLYIPSYNLEMELVRLNVDCSSFWFSENCSRLHRLNTIVSGFFQENNRQIRYVQPDHENGDMQLILKSVDVSETFRRFGSASERQFLLTTAVGDQSALRDYMLHNTGLDTCGDYESVIITNPEQNPPVLLIPTDLPEFTTRNHPAFLERLAELVLRLEEARGGRTVVVLNSVARMRRLAPMLADELDRRGVLFLQQHIDGGRDKLLRTALSVERCVILGSQAFYSGVGVDRGGVDTMVIEKVPFPFHKDELVAGRRKLFRSRGLNDFDDCMVPQAVLKLRGAVRQIRPDGLFVIADGHVHDTGYFQALCDALTPSRVFDSLPGYLPWAAGKES